jgi:hypothetical protein
MQIRHGAFFGSHLYGVDSFELDRRKIRLYRDVGDVSEWRQIDDFGGSFFLWTRCSGDYYWDER